MANLDSQGEIVSIELLNPDETQIWKGENESVSSRQHLFLFLFIYALTLLPPLFDKQGLDAMVTV